MGFTARFFGLPLFSGSASGETTTPCKCGGEI